MNLERMKQAAIANSKERDKWAVVCTDGDIEYAQTDDKAKTLLQGTVSATEFTTGEMKHDYGLVRVDVE